MSFKIKVVRILKSCYYRKLLRISQNDDSYVFKILFKKMKYFMRKLGVFNEEYININTELEMIIHVGDFNKLVIVQKF